jgi:LmbE family N-acetylglucosaminyl deacetylase
MLASLEQATDYDSIYIAPHLDDAALSCGGRIALQVGSQQRVLVVTLCAGSPPADAPLSPFAQYLHRAWALGDDPIIRRRREDERALAILDCDGLHLDLLDAPYRVPQYGIGDGWRGNVAPADPLIAAVATILARLHTHNPAARFYVPLGVGNHVDHQLVCAAGADLATRGADVAWYEDAPYAAKQPDALDQRLGALGGSWQPDVVAIGAVLQRKLAAIAAYESQQRELFGDADMRAIMTRYAERIVAGGGERAWQRSTGARAPE